MTQSSAGTAPPRPPAPVRRTAWAEGTDRLRAAATTEPGRLRIIGAILAALVVVFGATTAWQVSERAEAAEDVARRSQPLSADAASIYRSLADADTTAAEGFLTGGQWPREVRERYERDIGTASALLVKAAAASDSSDPAGRHVRTLNEQLPVYTGLIEQARANGLQGLPLGGAYLRHANDRMRSELLPAARALYDAETDRLGSDYDDAGAWPWLALGSGAAALAALVWAQRRDFRRTNRVFNPGLVAATAAAAIVLLWLATAHTLAWSGLTSSYEEGARSLRVLNEARIASLQARGDESLTLMARGAVLNADGEDFYEAGYRSAMNRLAGSAGGGDEGKGDAERGGDGKGGGQDGKALLGTAASLSDDREGSAPVAASADAVRDWRSLHRKARATDDNGEYEKALRKVIGSGDTTGRQFDRIDASLRKALAHEQREFADAAGAGRSALTGLAPGAVVITLLGAVGALLGIGRRLSEYR
ncbi:hypothetical protein [Streptomyces sp. NPDC051776]|uniref:hypothetical protein n=1 Tax=Streptomyces sp. NPDC051776 TaxID=3155414 RepID=UPI0034284ECB